ncbi:MAG TPA: hypothetical protein VGP99_05485 [Tepidisphaeraceae bacterium]|jgi:hypothetical protein|nr:hypothetical protein [Tepidisphaeraceae bacterium]
MGETTQTVIGEAAADGLLCLRCGYDLRGNAAERCSECGWEIDRELLSGGTFPWERRRYRGRFVSYVKTVWQVSVGSRKLRDAAERRHALADGLSFARVTGAIAAIALVGIFFLTLGKGELWRLAISAQTGWPPPPPRPVWVEELLVPWSAGVTLLPVVPAMLIVFAFFITRSQRRLFAAKDEESAAAQSAAAVGCYAAAPMAWLLPAAILFAAWPQTDQLFLAGYPALALMGLGILVALFGIGMRVRHAVKHTQPNIFFMPAMLLAGTMLFVIPLWLMEVGIVLKQFSLLAPLLAASAVILLSLFRIVQWAARVRGSRADRATAQGVRLIGLWLLEALFLLGILPWCIGLVWIVIDSFR